MQQVHTDELSAQVAAGDNSGLQRLFAAAGLPAPTVQWQPVADAVPTEALQFLLEYWSRLPRHGDLPDFQAVDAMVLRPALGYVNVLEVIDGGRDFRYRVFGSKLAERFPADMNGRCVSELPTGTTMIRFFLAVHQAAMQRRQGAYTRHEPPPEVEVAYWDRLSLPLADADGTVVRLLSGNVPGPWRQGRSPSA